MLRTVFILFLWIQGRTRAFLYGGGDILRGTKNVGPPLGNIVPP